MCGAVLSVLQWQDAMLFTLNPVSLGLDSAPCNQCETKILDTPFGYKPGTTIKAEIDRKDNETWMKHALMLAEGP